MVRKGESKTFTLTPNDIREYAAVLGTCECGKPAQTGFEKEDGTFGVQCVDCAPLAHPKGTPSR